MVSRKILGLILGASTAQVLAGPMDLVELTGQIGFSCGTGTGGFEYHCAQGGEVERGTFRLIYDPLIPDSDKRENIGSFRGAIRSFEMTIGQLYRPELQFSLVGRGNFYRDSTWSDHLTWSMVLKEENNIVDASTFSFGMYRERYENANTMPALDFWDSGLVAYVGGGAGVNETDWLNGKIHARTIPRPVSAPSSSWLLLIGGAAALLRRRHIQKI